MVNGNNMLSSDGSNDTSNGYIVDPTTINPTDGTTVDESEVQSSKESTNKVDSVTVVSTALCLQFLLPKCQ